MFNLSGKLALHTIPILQGRNGPAGCCLKFSNPVEPAWQDSSILFFSCSLLAHIFHGSSHWAAHFLYTVQDSSLNLEVISAFSSQICFFALIYHSGYLPHRRWFSTSLNSPILLRLSNVRL